MENLEFDLPTLKEILRKVYLKAVNSYHDLSECVIDEVLNELFEEKKQKLEWQSVLNQKKSEQDCIKKAMLCPVSLHDVSFSSTTLFDFNRQIDYGSLNYSPMPNLYDYNITYNSTNSNITVVSTLNVT